MNVKKGVIIALLISIAACIFLVIRLEQSRATNERYRERERIYEATVAELQRNNKQLELTIDTARGINNSIGESLSRQSNSIKELRELLQQLRENYEAMEVLLNSTGSSSNDSDSSL